MAANPQQQIQAALVPAALPQEIVSVPTINRQVQYKQYDPDTVKAYKDAMQKTAPRASTAELLANALAGIGDTPSYEGAYGTQTTNPIVSGISNAIRSGAGIYGARAENERAKQADQIATEQALAQLDMENGAQNVTDTSAVDWMKVNTGSGTEDQIQKQNMNKAAADALLSLYDLAQSGEITPWNNETGFWGGAKAQQNIGKRQAAYAALLPITNQIAKASGGSGINTLPEMMAYLGMVDNSTSEQLKGALPGVVNKMPQDVQVLYTAGLTQRQQQQQQTNLVAKELQSMWNRI